MFRRLETSKNKEKREHTGIFSPVLETSLKKYNKKAKKVLTKTCKHGILLLVRKGKRKRLEARQTIGH